VLKLGNDDRYETKCATCMRASPVMAGPLDDAESRLRKLAWFKEVRGGWHCPVCTTRTTAKRKKYE
jgi:hypothetical protein